MPVNFSSCIVKTMLTKSDLGNIKSLIQTETRKTVQEETPKIVRTEIKIANKKQTAEFKKDLDRIEKKLDVSINFLDRDHLNHQRRVERIEKHLHLSTVTS